MTGNRVSKNCGWLAINLLRTTEEHRERLQCSVRSVSSVVLGITGVGREYRQMYVVIQFHQRKGREVRKAAAALTLRPLRYNVNDFSTP